MSADDSVFMAVCPLTGKNRVAIAHKDAILVTTGAATVTIPTTKPVRALAFVPVSESGAQQTTVKSAIATSSASSLAEETAATASAYIVIGGDDKVLTLIHLKGSSATIVDTHGPVGKKVTHLTVLPTVSASSTTPFAALVAKAPTGIAPYAATPSAGFATKEAPSVALAEDNKEDEEENDENNVKAYGLSAKDGYAVAAGRYYPNQIANVVFANKFGEVYVIALLQTPNGVVFGPAPVFLLQHFSVLSTFTVAGYNNGANKTSSGRIVTCDRDGHVRVSKYPAAFELEQFLWKQYDAPKEGDDRPKQQDPAAVAVGSADAKAFFVGDASGRVTQWVSANEEVTSSSSSSSSAIRQPWLAKASFDTPAVDAPTESSATNHGGVVGLALLKKGATLVIARDHVSTIEAIDVTSGRITATAKAPAPVMQFAVADDSTAVALLRDGSLYAVDAALAFSPLVPNMTPSVTASDAPCSTWAQSLKTVDLYFAWKSQYAENKQRREEERQQSDEKNKTNPKTNQNNKKEAA